MKHMIVKQKSTLERFRKKNVKVYGKFHVHMCDGSKRGTYQGKNYRHPPVAMHLSGTAPSGILSRIIRYECPVCGLKTTWGRTG